MVEFPPKKNPDAVCPLKGTHWDSSDSMHWLGQENLSCPWCVAASPVDPGYFDSYMNVDIQVTYNEVVAAHEKAGGNLNVLLAEAHGEPIQDSRALVPQLAASTLIRLMKELETM